jgi:hypothetical protein
MQRGLIDSTPAGPSGTTERAVAITDPTMRERLEEGTLGYTTARLRELQNRMSELRDRTDELEGRLERARAAAQRRRIESDGAGWTGRERLEDPDGGAASARRIRW